LTNIQLLKKRASSFEFTATPAFVPMGSADITISEVVKRIVHMDRISSKIIFPVAYRRDRVWVFSFDSITS